MAKRLKHALNWLDENVLRRERARSKAVQRQIADLATEWKAQAESWNEYDQKFKDYEANWERHIEAFIDAVPKMDALIEDLFKTRREVFKLHERIEFVRMEMLYEFGFGNPRSGDPRQNRESRIVAVDKVAAAQAAGLRLNIGCGHIQIDGYVNVDQRELPGVDVIADAGNLPFGQGSVKEMFSAHVLEHFPQEQLRRLLPYWRGLLAPDGVFRAIVPDGDEMLRQLASGAYEFEDFRTVLFGGQEYNGDFHFNLLTPESLTTLLAGAGFTGIEVPARGRRNGLCFEFEIKASPSA